jgi:hypothetical protein
MQALMREWFEPEVMQSRAFVNTAVLSR